MFYTLRIILLLLYLYSIQKCCIRTEAFFKKAFLKISQNSQENTCNGVSFLSAASNCIKKGSPAHMFSVNFAKLLKTSVFIDHFRSQDEKH